MTTKITFIVLLIAFAFTTFALASTWQPPQDNAPENNAPAPINVSDAPQTKLGGLTVGSPSSGLLRAVNKFFVGTVADEEYPENDPNIIALKNSALGLVASFNGGVGATKYCDLSGLTCKTIAEMGGVGGGVTKIITGTNITISPVTGVGNVTISSSGGTGDNLGNHTATQALNMNTQDITSVKVLTANSIKTGLIYDNDDQNYYVNPNFNTKLWDLYAKKIYDNDDSSFYADPNSSSRFSMLGVGTYAPNSTTNRAMEVNGNMSYGIVVGRIGDAAKSPATGVHSSGDSYDFYAAGPGTDYGSSSSVRWKKNIERINGALAKVLNLRGVYFDWDKEHGGGHDIGMIAEEVGKVVPEIVNYEPDGIYAKSIDYGRLTPLLINAIKEQQTQIEVLKQEVEMLKAKIK